MLGCAICRKAFKNWHSYESHFRAVHMSRFNTKPEEAREMPMTDPTPDPCTEEAREQGCICRMSSVNSASIDPPEPEINLNCPLHGNEAARDPDAAYERHWDEAWMRMRGEDY